MKVISIVSLIETKIYLINSGLLECDYQATKAGRLHIRLGRSMGLFREVQPLVFYE